MSLSKEENYAGPSNNQIASQALVSRKDEAEQNFVEQKQQVIDCSISPTLRKDLDAKRDSVEQPSGSTVLSNLNMLLDSQTNSSARCYNKPQYSYQRKEQNQDSTAGRRLPPRGGTLGQQTV